MKRPLRLLHLEDDPDYSDLVRIMLTKEGYEVEVVLAEGRAAFEKALAPERFDLILADYLLPSYNGLAALRAAQKKCPETPFLLVSGTIGEYAAIESLKAGATDYVLKNWPEHLVPAVRRAIQEAEERRQRRRAEAELVRRERHFRAITENSLDILTVLDQEGHFIHNSPSIKRVLGYEPRALIGKSAFALIHPEDLPRVLQAFEAILKTRERPFQAEYRFRHQDGSWRFLEGVGQNRLQDSAIAGVVVNARDITDRKQAEEALRRSEERYRLIFDSNPKPTMVFDHLTLA
ncbi:MAG TPA: PAS domain S-box protein, partial [Verrucomicrobiota bacterium]|nr:PAS domain S-box protein [Verrucomicrobiota bacterium]